MSGTNGKRVTAMPRFNPLIKDDRLLPGYCFSRRETPKPKKKEAPKEELISTDPEHVLSMEADTRKEWFQMALMQAATGVLKSANLYAVILEPAFASTKELKKMVEANMHFFSPKQQKELKKVAKSAPADGAKFEGARDAERGSDRDRGSAQPSTDTRKEDGAGTAFTGSGDASRGGDRSSSSRSASPRDRPHKEPASGVSSSREDRTASAPVKSKRKEHSDADDSRSRSEKNSSKRRRRENGSSRDDGRSKRSRADRSNSRGRTNGGRRHQSDEHRGEAAKRAVSRSPDGRGHAGERRRDRSRGEGRRPRDYREGGSSDARTDGRRRAARRDSHDDSPPASERQPRRST